MSSIVEFIGAEPQTIVETVSTPTAGQTTWNVNYVPGRLFVFLNGVKLLRDTGSGGDFTANNGTSVVLSSGAATSDRIEFLAFDMGACA